MSIERSAAVSGKTIELAWTEGPTAGSSYDHVFHADGTVEWHDAGKTARPSGQRPPYAAMDAGDQVCLVSYLAPSGFTLTVALDFGRRRMVGIASGGKDWFPVRGTFQLLD